MKYFFLYDTSFVRLIEVVGAGHVGVEKNLTFDIDEKILIALSLYFYS